MKFSIQSKILLGHMASVGKAVNPKSVAPILSNFLVVLDGGRLSVTGSDQETVVTTTLQAADAEGSGRFCIDAKRVLELLKAMPDCLATFEVDDASHAACIRYTNGRYDLMARSAEDYPAFPAVEGEEGAVEFSMPGAQIAKCMDKVAFAVGKDDFRPQLQGVLWDVKEDCIVFVATDTRQLAKYRSTQTAPGAVRQFILPAKAAQMVGAAMGKEASVKVTVGSKGASFVGEGVSMSACLVAGRFPDYDRVIPTGNDKVMEADREAFLSAVRRVAVCADSQNSLIRLSISPSQAVVTSQDLSFQVGGKESVACEYGSGEEMLIGFSGSYLCNVLEAIGTQRFKARLAAPTAPGVFLPAEDDEFGELTLLCMPMSIDAAKN